MSPEVVSGIKSELGEGPIWDDSKNQISWVCILNGHIHEWSPASETPNTISVGQMIGAMAVCEDGNYIAALKDGFGFVNRKTGHVDMIKNPEEDLPENRFNDGKCDPAGRFWAGTMPISEDKASGSLYMLSSDKDCIKKETDISISNGLAWSLDHKVLYYIDTPTLKVVGYDYDNDNGNITNKRTVINIPKEEGFPDGMTIDNQGMLWIAHWGGWQITRWDPRTGKKLSGFELPVSNVTSCTFGGESMSDIYITSARKGLSMEELEKQPLAGSLFVIRNSGFTGLLAHRFKN
ncbi:SMP-30/gluconolactonase/LRE family protein [Arenibacter sp. F20364]|uniref:SMP-30/gluconolactonase/LRE family protein n=1 Tax=Arenibacter sp. F20364 TaxID=2926415 RepID=UPI001FF3E395|nr:SMP-30/gluconolactonase/LRE family protein [Arenibacter sp. F20364]MCK0192536.1 SMP-30/gluconolactonase/LRE family protein [Arenibacter sp. F20364]